MVPLVAQNRQDMALTDTPTGGREAPGPGCNQRLSRPTRVGRGLCRGLDSERREQRGLRRRPELRKHTPGGGEGARGLSLTTAM